MRRMTGEGAGRGVFPNQLISGVTAAAGYSLISTCYQPPAVGRAIHRRPRPALPSHLTDNVLPTMNTNRSLYIIAAHNAICALYCRRGPAYVRDGFLLQPDAILKLLVLQ